jgi:hypothetical protein
MVIRVVGPVVVVLGDSEQPIALRLRSAKFLLLLLARVGQKILPPVHLGPMVVIRYLLQLHLLGVAVAAVPEPLMVSHFLLIQVDQVAVVGMMASPLGPQRLGKETQVVWAAATPNHVCT